MSSNPAEREFKPLNIAVMTVSDTRTEATDTSGDTLGKLLTEAGHRRLPHRLGLADQPSARLPHAPPQPGGTHAAGAGGG